MRHEFDSKVLLGTGDQKTKVELKEGDSEGTKT